MPCLSRGLSFVALAAASAFALPTSATETIIFGVQPATQPIYIARAIGLIDKIEQKHDVEVEFRSFS